MTWYGKKQFVVPALVLGTALLAGCGSGAADTGSSAAKKPAAFVDAQIEADQDAAAKAAAEKAAAEKAAAAKAAADKAAAESAAAAKAAAEKAAAEAAAAKAAPQPPATAAVYYKNCDAVRAAGAAPIRRGDPGYAKHLDRDGDGQGCGAD